MRAIVIERNGGPEVLELQERPEPEPGAGQLLVDVAAAGVNFYDTAMREGAFGGPPPILPGGEGAGRVLAVGEGVEGFAPGDRVGWASGRGGYAERALVAAERALPLPEGVSDEQAAASLLQGMTAHYLSHGAYPVQPGDWVVVHAAAGGVGGLLTQLAKLRGGHVLATTSTPAKAERARAAGADEVVGYEGFAERARELTGGEGVAAVYDGVGAATFDESLASLGPRGVLVLYGSASGPVPPFDTGRLASGSLYLTRPDLGTYTRTREELLERAGDVLGWIADGRLQVEIGGRYPLAEARRAHEDLQGRRTTGKLLLVP
jgi:NADPH2:quinone reductase